MIKISVVVPIYNVEKYLAQCLDSILEQSLKDIEIICINDGSKDSSLEILKNYAQKDARILITDKENTGYGNSLNLGISSAQGEYIAIIEPDDFISKNMFEDLYNIAKQYDADVAKSDWFNFWTKDNQIFKKGKISPKYSDKIITAEDYPEILCIQPSVWSAIYKKSFLTDNNIKFLNTPGASYQDTSFSFKVFSIAKRIIMTTNAYLYYRQDNENSSINSGTKADALFTEYDEINNFICNNKETEIFLTQKLINEYKAYIWTLKRISPELRKDFVYKFSKRFKEYSAGNYLKEDFIKKIGRKKIEMLINSPSEFLEKFEHSLIKEKWNNFRRNLVSVRINKARISIKLFGKQIINIG